MVLADKHPLRQPTLPPLCEPSPPHKVGGFLHLCTLSSVVVHANTMHDNREKKVKTYTHTRTNLHLQLCVSFAISGACCYPLLSALS